MSRAQKKQTDFGKLIERDLTALAREGRLPAAHGVDAAVDELGTLDLFIAAWLTRPKEART